MDNLLAGYWVLCTAVHPREREELARQVAECGGVFLTTFSAKDPPHLVITRSVRSPKYRALLRAHPHTPVVTPDWLADSAQAGRRLPYDAHRVGPFYGLTVCFSGLALNKKGALAAVVTAAGGQHSPALDKKCTHLVTDSTDSEKYRFAVREGIPVVHTKWVEDSLEAGWCQDESAYSIADEAPAGQAASGAGGAPGGSRVLPTRDGSAPPSSGPATAAAAAAAGGGKVQAATLMDEATALSDVAPAPAGSADVSCGVAATACAGEQQQQQQQGGAARGRSRLQRASSVADVATSRLAPPPAGAAAAAADPQQQQLQAYQQQRRRQAEQQQLDEQLDWDDGTSTYLDAVRLHPLGCTPAESREVLALVRQGAAKRFADWRDDINHVVVGSDLSPGEAADALDFLSTHRSCMLVNLDWLRQSVAAVQRLRPDGFLVPLSRLTQHRRMPAALELKDAAAAAGRLERTASQGIGEAAAGGSGAFDLGRTQSMGMPPGPLDGCYFTLAAVRGSEAEQRARRLIQENGGRVFTETTLQRVTDKSRAFAICPPAMTTQETTQLRNACPDFKLVEDKQRFTIFWLECSLEAGMALPPSRGAPLYQPLPYALPLRDMTDVVACTSGYDTAIRAEIGRCVETLGGSVTYSMSTRNTHLLLPVGTGIKFELSADFGVIPVTADWLIDTMGVGRRQQEDQYHPPLAPGQLPPMKGAAAARAGGGAGGSAAAAASMLSEIAITQMAGQVQQRQGQQQQQQQGVQQQRQGQQQAVPPAHRPPQPPPPRQQQAEQQQPARQQLVLPPPPANQQRQQQQQQALPGAAGCRRLSLRERMRASQPAANPGEAAAAAELAAGAGGAAATGPLASGWPARQQQPQQQANDENAVHGSNCTAAGAAAAGRSLLDCDAAQATGKQQAANNLLQQQAKQQQQQCFSLDDALASLDEGLKQQQQRQLPGQQQQQRQPAASPASNPPSLFEAFCGTDPLSTSTGAPAAQRPAAAAAAGIAPPSGASTAAAGSNQQQGVQQQEAEQQQQGSNVAQQQQRQQQQQQAGRGSGSGRAAARGSSRLRPAGEPLPESAAVAVAAAAAAAEVAAAEGSEMPDDLAMAVDRLGDLLGGLPAEAPLHLGSQLDVMMPPPAARTRNAAVGVGGGGGGKRGGAQPAESSLSNMSSGSAGGSRGRGAKRLLTAGEDDVGSGGGGAASGGNSGRSQQQQQARRSGRGRAEVPDMAPQFDMSQQVGYAELSSEPPARRPTRSSATDAATKQLLKRHLAEAAGKQRRGAASAAAAAAVARSADPLADLMH